MTEGEECVDCCEHDIEVTDWLGHITCYACGRVRMVEYEWLRP